MIYIFYDHDHDIDVKKSKKINHLVYQITKHTLTDLRFTDAGAYFHFKKNLFQQRINLDD